MVQVALPSVLCAILHLYMLNPADVPSAAASLAAAGAAAAAVPGLLAPAGRRKLQAQHTCYMPVDNNTCTSPLHMQLQVFC
jgi:hypothetical protein